MEKKNYMTPSGFKKLEDELRFLKTKERPEVTQTVSWAAGNGDRSENGDYIYGKKKLRQIDKRIEFLVKQIDSADVVDPLETKSDKICFGATVKIEDEEGVEKKFSIVGLQESDIAKEKISWKSPLGSALLGKVVGDVAIYKTPRGEKEAEILEIIYKEIL